MAAVNRIARLFPLRFDLRPGPEADRQLAAVPDKPAVFLLATEDDQPILLASGLAVRGILRRRLGEPIAESGVGEEQQPSGPNSRSRRADLRPIVRRCHLLPTCSPFETDLHYLWLARRLYPADWRSRVPRRHCWMVHGDAGGGLPRLTVTDRFDAGGGVRAGPLADRRSAVAVIELASALFGLCHTVQVLRRSPGGRACEYREMGRCSGVCDGSITLDQYRAQVAEATAFVADAGTAWRTEAAGRMAAAARSLDFESAGRTRDRIERAARLMDSPRCRWLADAERMDFLIVQPGEKKAELRTFRSFAGRLVVGPTLDRGRPGTGLTKWLKLRPPPPDDAEARAAEAALLADYLYRGERGRGLFLRFAGQSRDELAQAVAAAFPATVRRRKQAPPATGG